MLPFPIKLFQLFFIFFINSSSFAIGAVCYLLGFIKSSSEHFKDKFSIEHLSNFMEHF